VDCATKTDPSQCINVYDATYYPLYANFPDECPNMGSFCPSKYIVNLYNYNKKRIINSVKLEENMTLLFQYSLKESSHDIIEILLKKLVYFSLHIVV
jgi:hypothetical protein